MTMFSRFDAEVKRLDQEPKAQKIFDEAQKAIHEAVSETKHECQGQMHDTAAQIQKKMNDLAYELKLTQAMVGSSSPPEVPQLAGRAQSQSLRQLGRKLR